MHNKWIAILILLILTALPVSAQGRELPTDICFDNSVSPAEASILSEIESIHIVNPYMLWDLSPSCRYVIAMFRVASAPEDERQFVGWDIQTGSLIFDYIRPRTTQNQIPVFHWNPEETEVLVGASHVTYLGDSFPIATYPFHLIKPASGEAHVLRCDGDYCLDPFFRSAIWDDHHNWIWSTGPTGVVAFDRNTGLVVNSYPNPPWDGGHYDFWYGHHFFFSEDKSHIVVYFQARSAAGLTVWDVGQHRAYPIPANYLGSYAAVALSPDNRYLAVGGLAIRVWDLQNLEPAYEDRFPIYRHEGPFANIGCLQFVDNTIIETRSADGVQLWDLHTGELIESNRP